jgi:archaemetzincin
MAVEQRPISIGGFLFQTIGSFPQATAATVVAGVSRRVAVPCRLVPGPPHLEPPYLPGRKQVDADGLLARLEAQELPAGRVAVGLTMLDLGNPIFTFFFGRARQHGRAALVSLARLDPSFYGLPKDDDLIHRRTELEILHELGHVAGLHHCRDFACIMRFASTVEAIDNRGEALCPTCRQTLPQSARDLFA